MEVSDPPHGQCLQIMKTAGDGHCLLYAVLISWTLQLKTELPPSLHMLKCAIFMESLCNRDIYMEYMHDVNTNADYARSVSKYLLQKHYASAFGDLVPVIIANAMSLTVIIKDVHDNELRDVVIHPRTGQSQRTITIHRANDHFSGISIKDNNVMMRSPAAVTQTNGKTSDVQPIEYTRSALLNLNSSSHLLQRQVRKNLFKNGLWQPSSERTNKVPETANFQAPLLNDSYKANGPVNHHLLRSLPKAAPVHKCNILKCAVVNAQSLRNKIEDFTHNVTMAGYDICIISETWLRKNDAGDQSLVAQLKIPGFNFLHSPRKETNRGGGLGIFFNRSIKVNVIKEHIYSTFEMCIWNISCKDINIVVVGVYRPPYSAKHRNTISKFLSEFSEILSDILGAYQNCRLMFAGDFNIHVNESTISDTVAFTDMLSSFDCLQYINVPTHISGHTLDLCVLPQQTSLSISNLTADSYLSDHCFVSFNLNVTRPTMPKIPVTFRRVSSINNDNFRADLKVACENMIRLDGEDLAKAYDTQMRAVLDKHAPRISKTIYDRKKVAWFDTIAKNLRKEVRKCENTWKQSRNPDDLERVKIARKQYRRHLRETKSIHFREAIKSAKGNNRQLYAITDGLMGKERVNPFPQAGSNIKLVEEFADYFLGKTEKIREELSHVQKYQPTGSAPGVLSCFQEIAPEQITTLLKKAKATTCDSDPIPSSLMKQNTDILIPVITKLVNSSLLQGSFYEQWKLAIVRPLLKSPSAELTLSQYRPVSNLSFLSKITEKCGIGQLYDHLTNCDLHSSHQSAYKENFSTETALCCLFNQLLWTMEYGGVSVIVALDLSSAFDTVEHGTLCTLLETNFGIEETSLQWIKSYLKDRKMTVKVDNCVSSVRTFNFSVPQGSCLGPLLFNLYSSTIKECIISSQDLGGYADDHYIKDTFNPTIPGAETTCIKQLEKSLVDIQHWMASNTLKMNASKTDVSFFGSKSMLTKTQMDCVDVGGEKVKISHGIKYLGVWLDCNLNMRHHIDIKIKTAAGNIRRLINIRQFIDTGTAKILACSLVLSHLDYANSILCGLPESTTTKLQRIQNWAAKVVLRYGRYESSKEALKLLHWLPVKSRIDFKILCLVYRSLHGTAPAYLSELLRSHVNGMNTRSQTDSHKLYVPFTRKKTFAARSFSAYAPRLWNALPTSIAVTDNFPDFKKSLKTFLFKKAFNC